MNIKSRQVKALQDRDRPIKTFLAQMCQMLEAMDTPQIMRCYIHQRRTEYTIVTESCYDRFCQRVEEKILEGFDRTGDGYRSQIGKRYLVQVMARRNCDVPHIPGGVETMLINLM